MNDLVEPALEEVPFELAALANAHNYNQWIRDLVMPHLGRRILELGAGIGNMSAHLPARDLLVLSEADSRLLRMLKSTVEAEFGMAAVNDGRVRVASLNLNHPVSAQLSDMDFDTVVSFNVFEHIQDDVTAMREVLDLLRRSRAPGPKRVITFVPAHQWAYGSMDEVCGHYRRYSKRAFLTLLRCAGLPEEGMGRVKARYFNLASVPGWFITTKLLRRRKIDSAALTAFNALVPLVRPVDDFLLGRLGFPIGQSLVAVARVD
ncbi:MAG: class I SAM-dependent methyltransferase [Bdellovibrionales bacterium]|nr:class I SAM-dependent methyltransferase [Bdellovibrionales bacterium]